MALTIDDLSVVLRLSKDPILLIIVPTELDRDVSTCSIVYNWQLVPTVIGSPAVTAVVVLYNLSFHQKKALPP